MSTAIHAKYNELNILQRKVKQTCFKMPPISISKGRSILNAQTSRQMCCLWNSTSYNTSVCLCPECLTMNIAFWMSAGTWSEIFLTDVSEWCVLILMNLEFNLLIKSWYLTFWWASTIKSEGFFFVLQPIFDSLDYFHQDIAKMGHPQLRDTGMLLARL